MKPQVTKPAENIPYLSEEVLIALKLSTKDIIDQIEKLIHAAAQGNAWSAPKAVIMPPNDDRYMMAALAAMDNPSVLAVKTVVLNPSNPQKGLPQINGLVTILDSETGIPIAIMDGNWITAVRTAALSATAAKHMANKTATSVGFVGCGVQARSHLKAFSKMFPLTNIKLFGRGQANIDWLSETAKSLNLTAEVCSSGQEAIEGVDLIVTSITLTDEGTPFLNANRIKQGAFATMTDLGVPWHKDRFSALDCITIDDVKQEASLPNKLCDPSVISGDLSGLVLGEFKGRSSENDRNAFLFRGHALGDLALSSLALSKYQAAIK